MVKVSFNSVGHLHPKRVLSKEDTGFIKTNYLLKDQDYFYFPFLRKYLIGNETKILGLGKIFVEEN